MTKEQQTEQRIMAYQHMLNAQINYNKGWISLAQLNIANDTATAVLRTVSNDVSRNARFPREINQ